MVAHVFVCMTVSARGGVCMPASACVCCVCKFGVVCLLEAACALDTQAARPFHCVLTDMGCCTR